MTVTELLARMPYAEFVGWRHYYRKHGFPVDRIVGTTARGASAICAAWDYEIDPARIVVSFMPRRRDFGPAMIAYAMTVPGAEVQRYVLQ